MINGRPEIIVDLDNTVYDWIATVAGYLHYQGVDVDIADYQSWEVWEDWDIPKGQFDRLWRMGIEDDVIYRQGPIIEGARDALWQLSDMEFHITLATNRLSKFGLYSKIIDNTVDWLREAAIPYRGLLFTGNKGIMGASFGLDDSPEYVRQMQEAGIAAYLFDAPHNQGDTDLGRITEWSTFVEQVEGMTDHG